MKSAFFAAIVLAIAPAFAQTPRTVQLTYDTTYDDPSLSLDDVACSNGAYGLINQGYSTLGSLPNFPYVGGVDAVTGWDSPACGTCYNVTYDGTTIYVLAVDTAINGVNLSEEAMNALTSGQAVELGSAQATLIEVNRVFCGIWTL